MINIKCKTLAFGILLVSTLVNSVVYCENIYPVKFDSPLNIYIVEFNKLSHKIFPDQNDVDVDHITYTIIFHSKISNLEIEAEYSDVYGWEVFGQKEKPKPTEISEIFKSFIWSPKEDFVILPEENWAGAPSSPYRKTINLNQKIRWSSTTLHMDIMAWFNNFYIFGNIQDDCDYRVVMFNGETGKQEVIMKSNERATGYQIKAVNGEILIINKLLDNCRTEEDIQNFKEECIEYNMRLMKSKIIDCSD